MEMDELVEQAQNTTFEKSNKDEDVEFDSGLFNRWTKYGKDRLYIENGDGYIDIKNKSVEGLEHNKYKITVEKEEGSLKVFVEAQGLKKDKVAEVF